MTHPDSTRIAAFDAAMASARERLAGNDPRQALAQLERAHVLGQRDFGRHWRVHVLMLRAAWALGDGREVRGQWLRLALTPLGHLTGRLPQGNTGRSNVSAFAPMDVPADLQRLLDAQGGRRDQAGG
jgi:Protein of unknown function (DUF3703)